MKKIQSKQFWSVIINRFFKAFISGALTGIAIISAGGAMTWTDLVSALNALAISMVIGGVNGVIMAFEKAYRYEI